MRTFRSAKVLTLHIPEPSVEEDFKTFVDLVKRCRAAQKAWFKSHNPEDLSKSKQLEREVDKAIAKIEEGPPPPDLFSGGAA